MRLFKILQPARNPQHKEVIPLPPAHLSIRDNRRRAEFLKMLLFLRIVGLLTQEEYYNLQDSEGHSTVSAWRLLRWIWKGKKGKP
jgi:hypothetical protein